MQKTIQQKPEESDIKTDLRRFLCPCCGKHTVLWLLPTTEIKDLPVKCKRCGKESVINISPVPEPETEILFGR
ncbi:MAG: hypothetical protein IJO75_02655 [Clostridia bacterium]|nr:hypothetical protein [Clostridia bacterium]